MLLSTSIKKGLDCEWSDPAQKADALQHRLRKLIATPKARQQLRQRVGIEHRLAHVAQRQGRRARYLGTRANLFDLRRCCAIQNLETTQAVAAAAAA